MRTLKKVRKLSHDNFVESYGVLSRSRSVDGRASQKRTAVVNSDATEMHGTFRRRRESHSSVDDVDRTDQISDGLEENNNINNNNNNNTLTPLKQQSTLEAPSVRVPMTEPRLTGPAGRRLRRFSLKKFPSTGDIHKAVTRRTKSEGMEDGTKEEEVDPEPSPGGRISSWHSQFSLNRRLKTGVVPPLRGKSPKRSLFRIPASRMSSAVHSGYLDRRNKKRKWEKFWCVIQDSCLYCYNSPQSEFTHDAIVLRGYIVSADISDVQRAKYTFKLEKNGSQTVHFRCDNHKSFMLWVCTIKKETIEASSEMSDNEILLNNVRNSTQTPKEENTPAAPVEIPNGALNSRRHTADNIFRMTRREHLDLELQKENLLREVLEQQKEIIKERNNIMPPPTQSQPYYVPLVRGENSPKPTRNEVMEKYERVKESQQMKILKTLTQLNRRRNSVQLKIDQLARETRPKARRTRSASRHIIQSMEARLALLQSEIAEIDQDIREQQISKEDMMENINQKRDLEIMVLDQQECLSIVKRHQSNPGRTHQERGRRLARRMPSTPVSFSHEHLTSIEEAAVICQSDTSSTSSGGSNSCSELNSANVLLAISSTPRQNKISTALDNLSLEDSDQLEPIGQNIPDCYRSCQSIGLSKSSSYSSDADEIMSQGNSSIEGALSDDFRSLSTSSYSDLDADVISRNRASSSDESIGKKASDIRPDVLAEIEEFEVFSKMMLQRISSTSY